MMMIKWYFKFREDCESEKKKLKQELQCKKWIPSETGWWHDPGVTSYEKREEWCHRMEREVEEEIEDEQEEYKRKNL